MRIAGPGPRWSIKPRTIRCKRQSTTATTAAERNAIILQRQRAKVCTSLSDFSKARSKIHPNHSVGFVPTMGALHAGHLELFKLARRECDTVIGSIFVNPAQFAPHEDFDQYPRHLERDVDLLAEEGLADVILAPTKADMYQPNHRVYLDPRGFDDLWEGRCRPGFFGGVATVVAKLFMVVQPHRAYFGQKDAAQCVLIRRLVQDLHFPVRVRVVPTCREPDGLALSSRNAYMSPEERPAAPVVYQSLLAAAAVHSQAAGEGRPTAAAAMKAAAEGLLKSQPLVQSIDYVSVGSRETMEELELVGPEGAVVSVAVRLGKVRLIDNILV